MSKLSRTVVAPALALAAAITAAQVAEAATYYVDQGHPSASSLGIAVSGSDHITIQGNYVYDTSSSGIIVWGSSNVVVVGNEVELASNGEGDWSGGILHENTSTTGPSFDQSWPYTR